MKKLILIALLSMAFITPTVAQNIVRYGDPRYLFNTISLSDLEISPWPGNPAYLLVPIFNNGTRYNVPNNTVIYGIAATMDIDEKINDSAGYTMYLYTVDNNNRLVCMDSITKYTYKKQYVYMAMNDTVLVESPVPCYEYYFSEPQIYQGPIYIGARKDSQYSGAFYTGIDRNRDQFWIWFDTVNFCVNHSFDDFWGGLFPIIQENIGCDAAVPEIREQGKEYVVLSWEMEGDSCQLSITPRDMPVDSGIVVDLQRTNYAVMGLDSGYYAARLRTQCHHHCLIHADTVVWSDWGEPLVFYFGSQDTTGGGIGIRLVETAPDCSITPNPAHGSATVQCSVGIMGVEVLSVKGETVMHKDVAGEQACTLDLTGLSKGIYIVQVTTPHGTATRKLAVE